MPLDTVINDKRMMFWAMQVFGWSAWALTFYLGVIVWGAAPAGYAGYLALIAAIGMGLTFALRWVYQLTWEHPFYQRAFVVIAASYGTGLAWMLCRTLIFPVFFPDEAMKSAENAGFALRLFESSVSAATVMLVWSALYFGVKYYRLSQEEKQRYLTALSMAHEAQLKMLRYQLNPHFLFNTLNAISTLILDKDTELANAMVMKLSRFLRYSLDNDPMALVTVEQEITSLKLYLDIEKVRFDDRLTVDFAVDPGVQRALMPSLLLQPLVENSIKYAISQAMTGGTIRVAARAEGKRLVLEVVDDGPGLDLVAPGAGGAGVGITNTRERLRQRYGDAQSFTLSQTEPRGLTVTLVLPLDFSQPSAS